MSNKANKGFIRELGKAPAAKPEKKPFGWREPVVELPKGNTSMATPHRMREFKSAKPSKTTIVQEHNNHVTKRRGEK